MTGRSGHYRSEGPFVGGKKPSDAPFASVFPCKQALSYVQKNKRLQLLI
jgi:hypothetical protein